MNVFRAGSCTCLVGTVACSTGARASVDGPHIIVLAINLATYWAAARCEAFSGVAAVRSRE